MPWFLSVRAVYVSVFRFIINKFKEKHTNNVSTFAEKWQSENKHLWKQCLRYKNINIYTPQHCTRHLTVPQKTVLALLTTFTCRQVSLTPAIFSCWAWTLITQIVCRRCDTLDIQPRNLLKEMLETGFSFSLPFSLSLSLPWDWPVTHPTPPPFRTEIVTWGRTALLSAKT